MAKAKVKPASKRAKTPAKAAVPQFVFGLGMAIVNGPVDFESPYELDVKVAMQECRAKVEKALKTAKIHFIEMDMATNDFGLTDNNGESYCKAKAKQWDAAAKRDKEVKAESKRQKTAAEKAKVAKEKAVKKPAKKKAAPKKTVAKKAPVKKAAKRVVKKTKK